MIRAALIAVLVGLPVPALAHKVIATVFAAGDEIEGEIGFSNGEMARGAEVEVFDPDGGKLGQAVTDDEGVFLFRPTRAVEHHFRADLGAGHVAQAVMPVEELPAGLAVAGAPGDAPATAPEPVATTGAAAIGAAELARIVREEMRPLRREIMAMKEKNGLRDILGGIGFIAGLFGLGFYIAARRSLGGRKDG